MKTHPAMKTLAALALCTAGAAQAQVTVYGRINLTAEQQKTDAATTKVLQNNSSRWGIKGSEDLGSGLKAGFQLESGIGADTGTAASSFWGRQSELNLSGGFGTLRLGNFTSEAYFATADYISNHNHDTGTSSDALYAYIGRNGNKLAYRLPELAKGLSVEAAVSLKEAAANNTFDLAGDIGSTSGTDASQLTLGYNHNLSKRTKVYAFYTTFNDGSAKAYGGDFSSVALGLRHNF